MNPIDIDKIKRIVDILVKGDVIESILEVSDHGFGKVNFEIGVQNGSIKVISLTHTKTVKIE